MKIQSLNIAVPVAGCPNNCKFCVAKQHKTDYQNYIEKPPSGLELFYRKEYMNRMEFVRDNGCNTARLTSNGEVMLNKKFLIEFADMNSKLKRPFRNIELQSSGFNLVSNLKWLRREIGVNTIGLSINSFGDIANWKIQGEPNDLLYLKVLCEEIKEVDLILRLSLNMSGMFGMTNYKDIIDKSKEYGADQITFRRLYSEGVGPEAVWVKRHESIDKHFVVEKWWIGLDNYIRENGRALQMLPFGAIKFDVQEMSVVVDENCMMKEITEDLKYLILRPDCKLYSHWDTKGSLVF